MKMKSRYCLHLHSRMRLSMVGRAGNSSSERFDLQTEAMTQPPASASQSRTVALTHHTYDEQCLCSLLAQTKEKRCFILAAIIASTAAPGTEQSEDKLRSDCRSTIASLGNRSEECAFKNRG